MTDRPAGDMNIPFEPDPSPFLADIDPNAVLSGGAVVLAAAVPVQGGETLPALVFRFARPDGSGFYPPTVLVCSEADLAGMPPLIASATAAAIAAAQAGVTGA